MYPAGHHGEGHLSVSGHQSASQVQVRRWWAFVTFLEAPLLPSWRAPLGPVLSTVTWECPVAPSLHGQRQVVARPRSAAADGESHCDERNCLYWANCLWSKAPPVSRWKVLIGTHAEPGWDEGM